MENQLEFVDGLIFKLPREGAPDFVKGSLSMKREDLIKWLNSKQDEWINIDLKVGQSGKAFASVNTWKPNTTSANNAQAPVANMNDVKDDLPF